MAQITVLTEYHKESLKGLAAFIRIGAAVRPQHYGTLFSRLGGEIRSCALGAAWEGYEPTLNVERWLSDSDYHSENRFYIFHELGLSDVFVENPIRPGRANWLIPTIAELNDQAKWPREMIADWLDQLAS